MKKYWLVVKNTWDEMFTYRLNFALWRLRMVLQFLTIYFLWFAVIPQNTKVLGYDQSQILTYILCGFLLTSFVLSSRSYGVGDDINQGNLSNFLIRPINYQFYWFARDIGDKAMNLFFSVFELGIIYFLLQPPLFLQTNLNYLVIAIFTAIIALVMYFFLSFLLGLIGFWSPEIWAPRFIFIILITFFAGGMFPLDVLPASIYNFFLFLPFTYLLYFPLKIYLGQLPFSQIATGITISLFWIIALFLLVQFIWNKGLKFYTAYGR